MVQTGITITDAMDAGSGIPQVRFAPSLQATNNNATGSFKFAIVIPNHNLIIVLAHIATSIISNFNNILCHLLALSHKALKL